MANAVTPISTHVADAKARLMHQFKDKANLEALLDAITAQVQTLEDDMMDLSDVLDIDLMTGVNLDNIGEIIGQDREGRSDANYRIAMRERIAANSSSGTPDEIITAFASITGAANVDYDEDPPAGFVIYGDGAQPTSLLQAMDDAAPAGVYVGLLDLLEWEDSDGALWEDSDTIYVRYESTGR